MDIQNIESKQLKDQQEKRVTWKTTYQRRLMIGVVVDKDTVAKSIELRYSSNAPRQPHFQCRTSENLELETPCPVTELPEKEEVPLLLLAELSMRYRSSGFELLHGGYLPDLFGDVRPSDDIEQDQEHEILAGK